jgi:hypothetical protein
MHSHKPALVLRASCSIWLVACAVVPLMIGKAFALGMCGDPPPVVNESLKGNITGRANLLTRYFGHAELTGEVETARNDIFSNYPRAEIARGMAYFQYVMCSLLDEDKSLSTREKLNEWSKVKDILRPERVRDPSSKSQPPASPDVHQQSSGKCSPNTADIHGNISITCN